MLKNKAAISGTTNFRISSDLTPMQREHLVNLRKQLQERIDGGDTDATIKYVKQIPTIVKRLVKNELLLFSSFLYCIQILTLL